MSRLTYKQTLITGFCLFLSMLLLAQKTSQQEINEQVWKPFIKNFAERNTEGFMAVHSKDLFRVPQDANRIENYESYYRNTKAGNENPEFRKWKTSIELRFLQRIATGNQAFEVGYYKTSSTGPDGKSRAGYGKFHVVLRNENGQWKILVDADAQAGVNESIFQTANPLE